MLWSRELPYIQTEYRPGQTFQGQGHSIKVNGQECLQILSHIQPYVP